jgi:hypothetical protein
VVLLALPVAALADAASQLAGAFKRSARTTRK